MEGRGKLELSLALASLSHVCLKTPE